MNKQINNELKTVSDEFCELLNTLTEQQLNKVPFSQSWTAGQVGEHILKSNPYSVLEGETSETTRQIDEHCQTLNHIFLNFDTKLVADPIAPNYPTSEFIPKVKLLADLNEVNKNIIAFTNQNELGLLCLDFEFPTIGHLTRYEWVHFTIVHTKRHIHQLKHIVTQVS